MNKVILFGGTGKLGMRVAHELQRRNYEVTAVVRNKSKAASIRSLVSDAVVADVCQPAELKDLFGSFEVVVSTLGKSVSLNDKSKPGFNDIDLIANSHILGFALAAGVKKFVYVSAFGAEDHPHLTYFNAHRLFSEKLIRSGVDYSIIKPAAIMSAFADLMEMAQKGRLMNIDKGRSKTNPIFEGDLAALCADSIHQKNVILEAGGKKIYTRDEINQLIQDHVAPSRKVSNMPSWVVKAGLPMLKLINRNMYDKFAFFMEVVSHDLIAPQIGNTTLETYLAEKLYLSK
jgi:uncharacterized protein YbjT (DUF2867 family)